MIAAMSTGVFARGSWSRPLSIGGLAILILVEISTVQGTHPPEVDFVGTVTATALVAVVWILLISGRQPERGSAMAAMFVTLLGAGSVALVVFSPRGAAIIAAIIALSAAANRFDRRAGVGFAIVLIAAFLAATAYKLGLQPIALLGYALGLMFSYLATRSVAELRNEQARTQGLVMELRASRDAQVEAAALNERSRIAREIHDVLAHTLAALAVQLEASRVMLEQRHGDPEALAAVDRAHRLAKEGLDETRRAVSALRGDQVPGPEQLRQLVTDFRHDSGTDATLEVEGTTRPLPPESALAVYRTAQEALTNIRRHAHAERVQVVLRYDARGTELEVTDAGQPAVPGPVGGFGLMGMRERAELLGGTLDAGPVEGGFTVRLRLPA